MSVIQFPRKNDGSRKTENEIRKDIERYRKGNNRDQYDLSFKPRTKKGREYFGNSWQSNTLETNKFSYNRKNR